MLKEKIKALKNISFSEIYQKVFDISYKPIMVLVCVLLIIVFLLIAYGSAESIKPYSNIFVYISFFLSLLILFASLCEKIKTLKQETKLVVFILFTILSFGYAVIRVNIFPNYKQIEDVCAAIIIIIVSYFSIFLKRGKH